MLGLYFPKKEYFEFWNYVFNRQMIWYKRFILKQPYPWTDDPILRTYHFCNNYRELDRGTMYLIDKLLPIQTERKKVLFNVVAYRLFNSYGFFDKIGLLDSNRYDPYLFIKILDELKAKGEKIFSPAYIVCPNIVNPAFRQKDKHVQLAFLLEILKGKIDEFIAKIDLASRAKESLEVLKQLPGIGDFLAYEIWTDLTYFDFFKQGWTDNDFVNIGVGARWGINIMMGNDTMKLLLPEEGYLKLTYQLRDNMRAALTQLGLLDEWLKIAYKKAYSNVPFLSLRNIEHSLCEYRKYWRIKNQKPARKRLFKFEKKSKSFH